MPVGGVKEKLLAAVRAHIPNVVFPEENESDVLEIEDEHREKVDVTYAKTIGDVLKAALEDEAAGKKKKKPRKGARKRTKKKRDAALVR